MSLELANDLAEAIRTTVRRGYGAELVDLNVMEGGHSGITLKATIVSQSAAPAEVVIKSAPLHAAAVGRHDVLRQARILTVLAEAGEVAVPEVLFSSDGVPNLFIMAMVPGDASEPVLDDPRLAPEEVAGRARSAARMLARLHATPLDNDVLKAERPLDLAEELARWAKLMNAVPEELRPNAESLRVLLERTMPQPARHTVLHGDYRIGNTLCSDSEVNGVIDWEIWSVGDPRIDLGWFRLFCDNTNFPGASYSAPGMPSADELMVSYEEGGGEGFTDLAWFDAISSYKMAAVMGHNLRRHREGRHIDPYQEKLPPTIRHLVDGSLEKLSGGES